MVVDVAAAETTAVQQRMGPHASANQRDQMTRLALPQA